MPSPEELHTEMTATSNNNNNERTPLIQPSDVDGGERSSWRHTVFKFLEAKTTSGVIYERFIVTLIVLNVIGFIVGTLFVEEYNDAAWASHETGVCQSFCDALFFGNYRNFLDDIFHIGATSVLEIVTVIVFTIEYIVRFTVADLESPKYQGFVGRLMFIPTFFSLVDLASIIPFYVDSFFLRNTDLASSSFLRMFRLFRMLRAEGRYDTALTMMDDVYDRQKGILFTALFVGVTTWMTVSALYYLTERRNLAMVYCPTCSGIDLDTSVCTLNIWGMADCSLAGCPATDANPRPCYNMYESIPMASYYALLNLFGEFPLVDQHSFGGKIVGTLTAVLAAAVFAIPVGIIGNGFEDVIEEKRSQESPSEPEPIVEEGGMTIDYQPPENTIRAHLYNFLHASTRNVNSSWGSASIAPANTAAMRFDYFINFLIVVTSITYMVGTTELVDSYTQVVMDSFEVLAVTIFTVEYVLRVYSAKEDPKYQGPSGRLNYMTTFLALVDLLSFVPFWIEVMITGQLVTPPYQSASTWSNVVSSLRLLRILRFEKYTHAFTSFDDVVRRNADVLAITAFTALLFWVFFAAFLYISERDSPDPEMAANYRTVPDSMWMTLLNLTGESPLSQYSAAGKVVTGILGLFATGVFGIPIGVLGAGFEEIIEEENADNENELNEESAGQPEQMYGSGVERSAYNFANGKGSKLAEHFEVLVYLMIAVGVAVGVWQTVEGHENDFAEVEYIAVIFFTVEYAIRFVGAGADPVFAKGSNMITSRLRYIFSFYSIIDLLAIVPFYLALALPNTFIDDYGDFLRMLRTIRLVKLDNRIPSISLIDDVLRLKFNALRVAFFAAFTLWILFAAMIFLCEHKDTVDEIDPVPLYGCSDNCTMSNRFQNYFDSMVYTGIHLTGDYPITTYTWPARFVNFLMVIAAVGVVSIPSGLIASGFVEIVQSKNKKKNGQQLSTGGKAGDDWYDVRLRELENVDPPPSPFGPTVDKWQSAVNEYLNGKPTAEGHHVWSKAAFGTRVLIFSVIVFNVVAVLAESVPSIDRAIGNKPGNFFDAFEVFSVSVFAIEYILRLFCAPKNREALYSSFIYATTFFGIVDLLSTAPWFVQQILVANGIIKSDSDAIQVFRCFRIFRLLQLEDFITAFSKLDNVFRASKDVLKATGLLALIIWVGCGGLFYIFEENNPNWRACDDSITLRALSPNDPPGCYDFNSTKACNAYYPGMCSQKAFSDMPDALFYTAVFLGGEWGVSDFTWPGRVVCLFLCVVGIALYAIPVGTLFDSFGAVLGMAGEDEEDEEE